MGTKPQSATFLRAVFWLTVIALSSMHRASAAISAGDRLNVYVYNHPEISTQVTVDSLGRISLPLAGVIDVNGCNTKKAEVLVEDALSRYVRYPAVDVQILAEGRSVFVSGGPGGTVTIEPGETLSAALASVPRVDGMDIQHSRVDLTKVSVKRDGRVIGTYNARALLAAGRSGPVLSPGDTIAFVNKPVSVQVQGDVKNPGTAFLSTHEPLSDAIAQLGGLLPDAADAQFQLVRSGERKRLALGDAVLSEPARDGDVLIVPTAPRIEVAGMVAKAGEVELRTDFTLLSAIYEAGGPTEHADIKNIEVVHNGHAVTYNITAIMHGDFSQNPALQGGDLVFVPRSNRLDFGGLISGLFSSIYAAWDLSHF
jgi:protein involved in polysaccharide export with SLBB domain